MNEALFIITMAFNFVGILVAYKLFGKTGLFVWIGMATVITNLETPKTVDVIGLSVALGNVIYGSTFLCTDILSEQYGGKEARKGVALGFFTVIIFTILTQVTLLYIPNSSDFADDAMHTLFSLMPRICIGSIIAYAISNTLDTYTFDWIRKRIPSHLWVRNCFSTLTSQLIDSFLFVFIAFAGLMPMQVLIELSLTTYAIKAIVAICDTPFIYIAKRIDSGRRRQYETTGLDKSV